MFFSDNFMVSMKDKKAEDPTLKSRSDGHYLPLISENHQ
jgi:hypothetical protein